MTALPTSATTRDLYKQFHGIIYGRDELNERDFDRAEEYLDSVISLVSLLDTDVPTPNDITSLEKFIYTRHAKVLSHYEAYVKGRQLDLFGRKLFPDATCARWYLNYISPTKLVDGAWLHGVGRLDSSPVKQLLQDIYNDERGRGGNDVERQKDHIQVYKELLNSLTPERERAWTADDIIANALIDDKAYTSGCIQMALGQCPTRFLPEIIGYNLGYEQVALHLLITVTELRELGLDSTYFDLHVTVDNLDCGHARTALDAAKAFLAGRTGAELKHSLDRIWMGYRLSDYPSTAEDIIASYDLRGIVSTMLARKGLLSHAMHDSISIPQSSLGELMRNGNGPALLDLLITRGYFSGSHFTATRFHQLLQSRMIGTFTKDELRYLQQWFNERDTRSSMRSRL